MLLVTSGQQFLGFSCLVPIWISGGSSPPNSSVLIKVPPMSTCDEMRAASGFLDMPSSSICFQEEGHHMPFQFRVIVNVLVSIVLYLDLTVSLNSRALYFSVFALWAASNGKLSDMI